jgi:hypothetical protein
MTDLVAESSIISRIACGKFRWPILFLKKFLLPYKSEEGIHVCDPAFLIDIHDEIREVRKPKHTHPFYNN